jgi:hypothetical protein
LEALSEMRRLFVIAKVELGCDNTAAAAAAGYADPKQRGYECALRNDVKEAIRALTIRMGTVYGPQMLKVTAGIALDPKVKPSDRLKAAADLMDRFGYRPVSESRLDVYKHNLSDAEMDRQILTLAAQAGLSPEEAKKLLIAPNAINLVDDGQGNFAPAVERAVHTEPTTPEVKAKNAARMREYRERKKKPPVAETEPLTSEPADMTEPENW